MVLSQTPKPKLEWPAASHPPTLQVAGEGSGVEPEIAVPPSVFPLSPEVTGRRTRPRQVLMRCFFLLFSTRRFLRHLSSRSKRPPSVRDDKSRIITVCAFVPQIVSKKRPRLPYSDLIGELLAQLGGSDLPGSHKKKGRITRPLLFRSQLAISQGAFFPFRLFPAPPSCSIWNQALKSFLR